MNTSYYEIGGLLHECVTPSAQTAPSAVLHSSPIFLDAAKRQPTMEHAKRVSEPSLTELGVEMMEEGQRSRTKKFGVTLMRWSVGGALAPDPIPLVDEIFFATTFTIGAYLYATN